MGENRRDSDWFDDFVIMKMMEESENDECEETPEAAQPVSSLGGIIVGLIFILIWGLITQ